MGEEHYDGYKKIMDDYLFSYTEEATSKRPQIETLREWYTPDILHIIKRLNSEWETKNLPLFIEIENEKVKISHKFPDDIGNVAELRLFPKLAYVLGYFETEYSLLGCILKFNEEEAYVAPYKPKSFLEHEHLCYTNMVTKDQLTSIREVIEDSLHRHEKGIMNIGDFEEKKHLESWIIKGRVVKGERENLEKDGSIYILTIKDHSGEMEIKAFGEHGNVLEEVSIIGSNYAIERVYDWDEISHKYYVDANFKNVVISPNNVTVTIKDDSYQVKIYKV